MEYTSHASLELSKKAGFKVYSILVEGRHHTPKQVIAKTIPLQVNDPIFKISPHDIHQALKEISWIKDVHVHRQLPSTLYIKIIERVPIAIWQHQKKHYLVDEKGGVIGNKDISKFTQLPIIVGSEAPLHFPKILDILAKYPDLHHQITGLIWVGGRRWDLQFNKRTTIKLPEINPDQSIIKLLHLLKQKHLSFNDIKMIDLRLPDKVIITLFSGGELRLKGTET